MIRSALMIVTLALLVASSGDRAAASHTGLLFGATSRAVITMSEWKFSPSTITLTAGESIDLVLENKGTQSHVFMAYPAPKTRYKGAGDWWAYVLQRTYFQDMGEILVHSRGMFAVSGFDFNARSTVQPSIPGMSTSRLITSGFSSWAMRRPSSPELAVKTLNIGEKAIRKYLSAFSSSSIYRIPLSGCWVLFSIV